MMSLIKRASGYLAGRSSVATTVASFALLLFGSTSAVADIVVDANATPCIATFSAHYTTIQAAVSAATPGATIQVCPGNYPEQVTIATPLTLRGVTNTAGNTGAALVTLPGNTFTGAFTQILIQAAGVNLVTLGVDGANTLSGCSAATLTGILFGAGSTGTLKGVTLRNHNVSNGSGGYCGTGTPVSATSAASVTVTDSSVRNFDSIGIDVTTTSTVTVKTTTLAPISASANCIYANAPTVQVSSNAMSNCGVGVYVTTTVLGTVSGNTVVVGNAGGDSTTGIFCFPVCTGLTISGNQIFDVTYGISMKTSSEVAGVVIENNDISATTNGVYLFLETGNTVSNNTITDAQFGVNGISGNTLSGNTYKTVTTLTK
jgi:parallel beta-helix repeat protein